MKASCFKQLPVFVLSLALPSHPVTANKAKKHISPKNNCFKFLLQSCEQQTTNTKCPTACCFVSATHGTQYSMDIVTLATSKIITGMKTDKRLCTDRTMIENNINNTCIQDENIKQLYSLTCGK